MCAVVQLRATHTIMFFDVVHGGFITSVHGPAFNLTDDLANRLKGSKICNYCHVKLFGGS